MFQFDFNYPFSCAKKLYPKCLAGTGIALMGFQMGTIDVWSSPNIAYLTSINSSIPMSLDEASWLVSSVSVGMTLGSILGATILQIWGTRTVILLAFFPLAFNWILIMIANTKSYLYAARIIGGVGSGIGYTCLPLFAGELAAPQNRDTIASIGVFAITAASVTSSFLGHRLGLSAFAECLIVPCLLGICIFLWLPHTPHHLAKVKDLMGSKKSLNWYRGSENTDAEFKEVLEYVSFSRSTTLKDASREFRLPYFRKMLTLTTVLYVYIQICGATILLGYAEYILIEAKFHLFPPYLVVVLMYVAGLFSTFAIVMVIERCGRKMLMVASSLGVSLGLVGLGIHFQLMGFGYDPENFQLLPVASMILLQGTFFFGLMMVPNIVLGEVFPANVKGPAASVANLVSFIGAFTVFKSFQPLVDFVGAATVFYGNAVLVMLLIPYVLIFMPETKGRSLNQIQRDLKFG